MASCEPGGGSGLWHRPAGGLGGSRTCATRSRRRVAAAEGREQAYPTEDGGKQDAYPTRQDEAGWKPTPQRMEAGRMATPQGWRQAGCLPHNDPRVS